MTAPTALGRLFSTPGLGAIARHTPLPDTVRSLMAASATRLIDSAMLVRDPLRGFVAAEDSRVRTPLPDFPVLVAVRQLLDEVARDGFGPYAIRFFGLLGSLMIRLSGNAEQIERVNRWVAEGRTGAFCMTDRGGPLASQWTSEAPAGGGVLKVDKVWAMNACAADFAIVIVRRGRSMVLSPVILPPEALATARREASGAPFLDGHLPLGDLQWEGELDPAWVLGQGGPIAPKMFLTLARPWLIQALCAHVEWLGRAGRARIDRAAAERIAFLVEAARNQATIGHFDRFSEDQAMALKWIANETWIDLVANGAVGAQDDQRDLLGFSKMEGSSYRCFLEIYERNRRLRSADA
jgi:hypothetical protein